MKFILFAACFASFFVDMTILSPIADGLEQREDQQIKESRINS